MMSRTGQKAFTLVEVMISMALITYAIAGVIAGVVFAMRMTRLNTNAFIAKNITQSYFERMNSDVFSNVDADHYPDISYDSVPPVWLDEALDIRCKVDFEFKGFGRAEAGSKLSLRDEQADWIQNEWAGSRVYLAAGSGVGQYAEIISNNNNTLTLAGPGFSPAPGNQTAYMINNGKTVEIETTWLYRDKAYSQSIRSLIVNYRNEVNLGF